MASQKRKKAGVAILISHSCPLNAVTDIFHVFFSRLYSFPDTLHTDVHQCTTLFQDFLSSCALPKLSDEAVESLVAVIAADEVAEVLKITPIG